MRKLSGVLILWCFVLVSVPQAIEPPPQSQFYEFSDFSGGLNTQRSPHKIGKSQSPFMQNCLIDERPGSIVKRNGYSVAGSTNTLSKINFMMEYVNNNNQREMLVSDSSQVLTTKDFSHYTVLKTTLTSSAVLHGTQGRGKALICNGIDPCMAYDGNSMYFLDGNNGNPNVQIGKYPIYYLDRFWIGNTTSNIAALVYSENTSTDGFAIDPLTDQRAWPANNQLNIGLGDGKGITGEDAFRNSLFVHKDNGAIYTVFGTDNFTWTVRRTVGNYVGTVSADSIVQSDNMELYLGKDGVYAMDGINSTRISDDIFPDMQSAIGSVSRIVGNSWDTQAEFFANGNAYFSGTTTTASGFLQPMTNQSINSLSSTFTKCDLETSCSGGLGGVALFQASTFSGFTVVNSSNVDPNNNYTGYVSSVGFYISCLDRASQFTSTQLRFTFLKTDTTFQYTNTANVSYAQINPGIDLYVTFPTSFSVSVAEIVNSSIQLNIELDTITTTPDQTYWQGNGQIKIANWTRNLGSGMILSNTTGAYVSQITTISNVNFWDQFLSVYNTNGGNVNFYIKGATAAYGSISTETWMAITPNSIIPLPTNKNFVQWATTITASDITQPSNIDIVTINHNESGSLDSRPLGVEWKKRYWLVVSTQTSGTSTLVYVKSKVTNPNSNAWMKFTGINLRSLSRFGNSLYGGSSSSGVIYNLDNGTNDNGNAINMVYDTPEVSFNDAYLRKRQLAYFLDVDQSVGATLTFGASVNRAPFSSYNFSIDGTGRLIKGIYSIPETSNNTYFRYEFSNNEIDEPIAINGLEILYNPSLVMPQ